MHVNQNTLRESIKAQLNDIKSDNNEYQTIARFLRTKQIVYKYFGTNNEYYKTISALDISDLSKFYSNNISSSYALFVTNFT
ncbi:hypothetical protein KDL45_13810, partial [bacterium]|nr:hypothetical protein [bacterium]